ncbi:MAG: type II secretion system F family protein [Nitrospirota bacterium]
MPIFQYRGYNADGSEATGTVEANSLRDAVLRLRESGFYPKDVKEAAFKKSFGLFRGSDSAQLPSVTRQLATLLASGVTLMEALRSISEENRGFWKNVLVDIREKVAGGSSLSKAVEGYKVFPEFYVNMVASGETSGNLDEVLDRLADFLEAQSDIKAKIRLSMIYPVFMVSIGFIVLSFLFAFVVPKITKIFEDTESALPLITVVLVTVTNIFQGYWWLIIGAILSGMFAFKKMREKKRPVIDGLLLRMPGNLLQSLYFGRFSRTLSFLLEGGVPVLKAMELAAKSIGNKMLEMKVIEANRKVAEGARLSASLDGFPPVLLQLISTGEKSGKLTDVLRNAADSYEREFSRKIRKALSLLEPSLILLMGLIVGFIVLAVLLPIFQLNQLIK